MNVVLIIGLVYLGLIALNFLAVLWFGICFNEVGESFKLLCRWKYLQLMLIPIATAVGVTYCGIKEKINKPKN